MAGWLRFVGLGLALAGCPSPPLQSTWPKFHHDMLQTGQSQFSTAANSGMQKWTFHVVGPIRSSPVIADDGTIYAVSGNGRLYAIAGDGSGKWEFALGGPTRSSPAIAGDGTIYVGSGDGHLYAVNPDGSQKWKFNLTGGQVHSSPAVAANGVIYIGSADGNLFAVTPAGAQLWKLNIFPGPSIVRSPAIAADGTIYIGAESPDFLAVDPAAGTQKWNFTHPGNPGTSSAAVGPDGTIYVGCQDHNLYAIKPDGTAKWAFATSGNIVGSSPAIAADGTVYIGSTDQNLYAVDASGAQKWKFATGAAIQDSSPAIGQDGTVFVGAVDGSVYAMHPNGTQKWKFKADAGVDSSPAIGVDGTVYVGSRNGTLYALGAPPSGACPLQAGEYTLTQLSGGTIQYASLAPFALPSGGRIRGDVAAGDASCSHEVVVPFPNGFGATPFCIPALNFTFSIVQTDCGVGRIDSNGGSDFTISEVGDTSSAAVCGAGQTSCTNGTDTSLRLEVRVGDGVTDLCPGPAKANAAFAIPTETTVWQAQSFACPDPDGTYDPGTDVIVMRTRQVFDLTTDASAGDFADLDGDGCCIAGIGPASSVNPCSPGGGGPHSAAGSCLDIGGLNVSGIDTTLVAAGPMAITPPLNDTTFEASIPCELTATGPTTGAACVGPPAIDFAGPVTRCQ